MPPRLDPTAKLAELRAVLGGAESTTARELTQRLQVSQPVLSRLVARLKDDVLVAGKARATRYALRRDINGVGRSLPIYEVEPTAQTRHLGTLHALARGFYVEGGQAEGFYPGLPYFLHDMRPAGFLGRLIPNRHPELAAPPDIRLWSDDDCLRYFAHHGWDLPGSLLVGDAAFAAYLQHLRAPPAPLAAEARAGAFVRYADHVLDSGMAGSSAAGEQPKFLATVGGQVKAGRAVLVKFSPPTDQAVGQRVADLLWCEHLMHGVLAAAGCPSARSEVMLAGGRVFLQVERFDREAAGGRHGVLSLTALDLEFVGGNPHGWLASAQALARLGHLPAALLERVRWLALVGQLIGNNDMHGGNLAFLTRALQPVSLAPVYDMLPMLYAPYQGNLPRRRLAPPAPSPADAPVWASACAAATAFWLQAAEHSAISAEFRATARANAEQVTELAQLAQHLPR